VLPRRNAGVDEARSINAALGLLFWIPVVVEFPMSGRGGMGRKIIGELASRS
jgi:hypothetical protein